MRAYTTYADVLRPSDRAYAGFYDVALIIGGSLLVGLCAQIAFFLPFSPVPVTGQTFAVLLVGALLGARRGSLSMLAYLVEGAAGLPVFAMGQSGPAVLLGPRGGYIVGFIAAAYVTGLLAEKGWDRRIATTALAMAFGNMVIYGFGLVWLSCLAIAGRLPVGIQGILLVGLYPFIIGDLLKIALAAILLPSGWKLLRYGGLTGKGAGHMPDNS